MAIQVTQDEVLAEAYRALGEAVVRERFLSAHILRLEADLVRERNEKDPDGDQVNL